MFEADLDETAGYTALIVRQGASHRTAAELCVLFVSDVADLAVELGADAAHVTRCQSLVDKATVAAAEGDLDYLDNLVDIAETALADIGNGSLWVGWGDGYVIYEEEV